MGEMLPLETNPEVNCSPTRISGGECLWRKFHATGMGKGTLLGTWNVRSLYRAASLMAETLISRYYSFPT
jgi:hypothetical protein